MEIVRKKPENPEQETMPVLRTVVASNQDFKCCFSKGSWRKEDWIVVGRPDWKSDAGGWIQKNDCIENKVPSNATAEDLIVKLAPQTYASMVLKEKCKGNVMISAEMAFADRMAPSIVIASDIGKNEKGEAEYHEHVEVVLFDEGVNVWRHVLREGKSSWEKMVYWKFALKPNTKHTLAISLTQASEGRKLSVSVDGHEMDYLDESLPDTFHAGIAGCEGVNKFYRFSVSH